MCDKSHVHDLAAGCETAQTSFYPQLMCDKIHQAVRAHIALRSSDPDLPKSSGDTETEKDWEAWLQDVAHISETELDQRFEPEADFEGNLPPASDLAAHGGLPRKGSSFICKEDAQAVACVSVGSKSVFHIDPWLFFESGCAHDMVALGKVKHLSTFMDSAPPQTFTTANGEYLPVNGPSGV